MAMTDVLADVVFPSVTGIAEDSVVNQFMFDVADTFVEADYAQLTTPLVAFYNNTPSGGTQGIHAYLSESLSRATNAAQIKLYDLSGHLDGSPHGSPFHVATFTLGGVLAGTTGWPQEIAAVLTLRGLGWDGQPVEEAGPPVIRPRARYTGHIYLGPLNSGMSNEDNPVRIGSNPRGNITLAAEVFADAVAANGHAWSVWSRKSAVSHDVVRVEMDDAFDTQRRRGVRKSSTTVRTFS